jgi:hypothetical protein
VLNERAVAAEKQAREELRTASLAEAKATVRSGGMGQRFATLAALKRAGEVRVDSDLRRRHFAALMLPGHPRGPHVERSLRGELARRVRSTLDRYVVESGAGVLSLRRAAINGNRAARIASRQSARALQSRPSARTIPKVAVPLHE